MLDRLLLKHFARNSLERHADIGVGRHLLTHLVQLEGEVPAQYVDLVAARTSSFSSSLPELTSDRLDVTFNDWASTEPNVDKSPGSETMQPGIARKLIGAIEIEDETPIARLSGRGRLIVRTKLGRLPSLPLVFAEVLHDERPHVGD